MAKLSQAELLSIFNALKKELQPYVKGHIKARMDFEGRYELWSEKKDILVNNKVRNEIAFAALIVQSSYVGFYYMPSVNTHIGSELLQCLKGRSCFHIKYMDKEILKQVQEALKMGYADYKAKGWV